MTKSEGLVTAMKPVATRRRNLAVKAGAVMAVVVFMLTACGSSEKLTAAGSGDSPTYTKLRPGVVDPTPEDTKALDALPESVRPDYAGFWNSTRLGPNPYAGWKAPKAPWKLCYSSAYQGNSWRVEGLKTAQLLTQQLRDKGLVKDDLAVTDANNDGTLQANQITNLTQQGCNVIFAMQPPTIGVCKAFDAAKKAGTLVIAMQTGTDCTNVIQSDSGAFAAGNRTATWLAEQIKPGSTVVMCKGIPGVAAAEARQLGAKVALESAGMKVDSITGEWNSATVKSQMVNYLSTHQGDVAGVWDGGVCAAPVIQAFKQAGRRLPVVTGFEGSCNWMAATKNNGLKTIGFAAGGGQGVVEAYRIALRMLSGQSPKVNTLLYPLAEVNPSNFDEYYDKAMTENSSCSVQPKDGASVPDSYYDALFTGGQPAPQIESVLDTKHLPIQ
ncbi:substrate-binding domain-containing protein [Sphaerisporangium sp. NPDC051011]|uniref:substrate-binding domain-containing protein n=1 Tax=Sphaerisporangium sp. NPDC051011 TaxID=3155792 RepID=UPI0033D14591